MAYYVLTQIAEVGSDDDMSEYGIAAFYFSKNHPMRNHGHWLTLQLSCNRIGSRAGYAVHSLVLYSFRMLKNQRYGYYLCIRISIYNPVESRSVHWQDLKENEMI